MKFFRRLRLVVIPACVCALWFALSSVSQQPPAGPTARRSSRRPPQLPRPPQQQPPRAAREPVRNHSHRAHRPASRCPAGDRNRRRHPRRPAQQRPQLEAPKAAASAVANPNGQAIEGFEFRGAKRVPAGHPEGPDPLQAGRYLQRRNPAPRFHDPVEHRPLRRYPPGNRTRPHRPDRALCGHRAARDPLHRVPGREVASRSRKFWTASRNAKSG